MNSKQRRNLKRAHPYSITIYAQRNQKYFEHDEKVYEATKWCKKKIKGSVNRIEYYDKAIFKFTNEKDAMYFGLHWL